jgi:hypothetical protein
MPAVSKVNHFTSMHLNTLYVAQPLSSKDIFRRISVLYNAEIAENEDLYTRVG